MPKPSSPHPENTNKNYNAQNSQENILANRKGSDISNVEKPAQGTSATFQQKRSGVNLSKADLKNQQNSVEIEENSNVS